MNLGSWGRLQSVLQKTSFLLCPAAEERDNMQKRLQNLERLILRAEKPGEDKVSTLELGVRRLQ